MNIKHIFLKIYIILLIQLLILSNILNKKCYSDELKIVDKIRVVENIDKRFKPMVVGDKFLSHLDFKKYAFKGFTFDGKIYRKNNDDFNDLKNYNVSLIRLGIRLIKNKIKRQYSIDDDDIKYLDWIIDKASENNIFVVITMIPEDPYHAEYWIDQKLRNSIILNWIKICKRYKNRKYIAGFDLINEPKPPGDLKDASEAWFNFASKIVNEIRRIDKNHIIFFEPAPSASIFAFKIMKKPISDSNVVYCLQFYIPMKLTHQGVGKYDEEVFYPNEKFTKKFLMKNLNYVVEFSNKFNVSIYVAEFSCVRWAPKGSSYRWIRDTIELFNALNWSWTFHSFRGYHGWNQELPPSKTENNSKKYMKQNLTDRFKIIIDNL